MAAKKKQAAKTTDQLPEKMEIIDKQTEIQHQYQMFPTPDEKGPSQVVTRVKM